jgi:hypothetical protein
VVENLGFDALAALLQRVFALKDTEQALLVLIDLPSAGRPDHPHWLDRRRIAVEWFERLRAGCATLPFTTIELATYPNVRSNNGELPAEVTRIADAVGGDVTGADGERIALRDLLRRASVVLAPTELSATAPLKLLARELGFRGATLPDFRREMIPTLALDWTAVDARVRALAARLDRADAADIRFAVGEDLHTLHLDLRGGRPHISGGLIPEPGTVSNLPTGETYIVPYEGERAGDPSRSGGVLPVEIDGEVVLYRIERNRAIEVLSHGKRADEERASLAAEPAYGNLAELGLGVLGEWGIQAIGSVLLDEKLGLHLAFGRSDHFGGAVGPRDFRDPARVVHVDRVFVPECQPRVRVEEVMLSRDGSALEVLMRDGRYVA